MENQTRLKTWLYIFSVFITLYAFLYSVNLLGLSLHTFSKGFSEKLLSITSNPFLGLFLGIAVTNLFQSSSTSTSIIVGLVSAGTLTLNNAVPMILGANLGTLGANIFSSFGHATRKIEFGRAFSAAVLHEFFNILSVLVLFPIELKTGIITRAATALKAGFVEIGGMSLFSPIKLIIWPSVRFTGDLLNGFPASAAIMFLLAIVILFLSLGQLVRLLRLFVLKNVEIFIDRYLFGNNFSSFALGLVLTAIVQRSSVTISLLIPLGAAGILSIGQIFPYVLGANIGTTMTTIIASLATGSPTAVAVAFSHLVFNFFGICIFFPLRIIPISLAKCTGSFIRESKTRIFLVILVIVILYLIPLLIFALH